MGEAKDKEDTREREIERLEARRYRTRNLREDLQVTTNLIVCLILRDWSHTVYACFAQDECSGGARLS